MPYDPWQHTAMGKSQTFSNPLFLARLTQGGNFSEIYTKLISLQSPITSPFRSCENI